MRIIIIISQISTFVEENYFLSVFIQHYVARFHFTNEESISWEGAKIYFYESRSIQHLSSYELL